MHDVLAHRLSLVATYAGALEYRPDATPEKRAEAAGVVRSNIQEALDELREVVTALREDGIRNGSSTCEPHCPDGHRDQTDTRRDHRRRRVGAGRAGHDVGRVWAVSPSSARLQMGIESCGTLMSIHRM
jgi:Histidine kinase